MFNQPHHIPRAPYTDITLPLSLSVAALDASYEYYSTSLNQHTTIKQFNLQNLLGAQKEGQRLDPEPDHPYDPHLGPVIDTTAAAAVDIRGLQMRNLPRHVPAPVPIQIRIWLSFNALDPEHRKRLSLSLIDVQQQDTYAVTRISPNIADLFANALVNAQDLVI